MGKRVGITSSGKNQTAGDRQDFRTALRIFLAGLRFILPFFSTIYDIFFITAVTHKSAGA